MQHSANLWIEYRANVSGWLANVEQVDDPLAQPHIALLRILFESVHQIRWEVADVEGWLDLFLGRHDVTCNMPFREIHPKSSDKTRATSPVERSADTSTAPSMAEIALHLTHSSGDQR